MSCPKIIVIIPVYNGEKYLNNAVESVLIQNYENIEIVLVDDGSTDRSGQLCDELANKSSSIYSLHKMNGGVSSARNYGLEFIFQQENNLDHTYITFLDADDIWDREFLDDSVINDLSKGYDLIHYQTCVCNSEITRCKKCDDIEETEFQGGLDAVWKYQGHFASIIYSAKLLFEYNISFYNIKYSEDKIFIMQCLYLANKIAKRNKKFYYYRKNRQSVMHNRPKGIDYYEPIIDAYLKSDKELERYQNATRKPIMEGKKLAIIYLNELMKEHYAIGQSREKLQEFFSQREDLKELIYSNLEENKELYSNLKINKLRFKECVRNVLSMIKDIPIVTLVFERMSYPVVINK